LDEFAPLPHHARVRSFLIELHKAAIARDISREDCRNPPHGSFRRWGTIFATAYWMNFTACSVAVAHCQFPRTCSDDKTRAVPGAGGCVCFAMITSGKPRIISGSSSRP